MVVDTPNRDEAIVRAALAGSRLVLVPTATSTLELPRVWPIPTAQRNSVWTTSRSWFAPAARSPRGLRWRATSSSLAGRRSQPTRSPPIESSHASAGVPTSFQLRPFATLVAELGLINNRGGLAT